MSQFYMQVIDGIGTVFSCCHCGHQLTGDSDSRMQHPAIDEDTTGFFGTKAGERIECPNAGKWFGMPTIELPEVKAPNP